MQIVAVVLILAISSSVVKSAGEVTCSFGAGQGGSDRTERGLPGPPGKRGPMGLQGLKGVKGDNGRGDVSKAELRRLQSKLLALERRLENYAEIEILHRKDCNDVASQGHNTNGIYTIFVKGEFIKVYCDLESDGGGWLVFQKRNSGEVDFYLDWTKYQTGFGNMSGEFWLGLDALHAITTSGSYKLRVDLEDWEGNTAYAEYSHINVGDSSTNYRLIVRNYSGTAGNSMDLSNNQPFTTKDNDNDNRDYNCAVEHRGAWWYNACGASTLNSEYIKGGRTRPWNGMFWVRWRGNSYSMKATEMKIQRI